MLLMNREFNVMDRYFTEIAFNQQTTLNPNKHYIAKHTAHSKGFMYLMIHTTMCRGSPYKIDALYFTIYRFTHDGALIRTRAYHQMVT